MSLALILQLVSMVGLPLLGYAARHLDLLRLHGTPAPAPDPVPVVPAPTSHPLLAALLHLLTSPPSPEASAAITALIAAFQASSGGDLQKILQAFLAQQGAASAPAKAV